MKDARNKGVKPKHTAEPPRKRYVAICDVLGFKELVFNTQLSELTADYRTLVETSEPVWDMFRCDFSSMNDSGPIYTGTRRFGYSVFSDTLLLWSEEIDDGPDEAPIPFVAAPGYFFMLSICLLIGSALLRRFPLRVGIAFGECVMDPHDHIFVGPAIVDAYETEQKQNWIGAGCHPSCFTARYARYLGGELMYVLNEEKIREGKKQVWGDKEGGPIVRYPIPQKPGSSKLEWTLDWPYWNNRKVEAVLEGGIADLGPNHPAITKWQNAMEFYRARIALWESKKVNAPFNLLS